jgi:hypothetical protein
MQFVDMMKERGEDEIEDGETVEGEQAPAEYMRPPAVPVIQVVDLAVETLPETGCANVGVIHAVIRPLSWMRMICQARAWMHLPVRLSGAADMRGEPPRLDYVPRAAMNYNPPHHEQQITP